MNVTIDGAAVRRRPGELIIEAAERAGVFIPRFCYHPRMEPVGMCRMCLVEVSGPRGFSSAARLLLPGRRGPGDRHRARTRHARPKRACSSSCSSTIRSTARSVTRAASARSRTKSLSHGPGESRFVEEKRHWAKPIEIGPLVALDRERCIQCARCTRFADEMAGDAQIDFAFRGDSIEVVALPDRAVQLVLLAATRCRSARSAR